VAVFIVSFFFAAITTMAADTQDGTLVSGHPAAAGAPSPLSVSLAESYTPAEMKAIQQELAAISGLRASAALYYLEPSGPAPETDTNEGDTISDESQILRAEDAAALGIPADEVPSAPWIEVPWSYIPGTFQSSGDVPEPGLARATQDLDTSRLRATGLIIAYDGEPLTEERIRTALLAGPLQTYQAPLTIDEMRDTTGSTSAFTREYAYLANLGVIIATVISGISMAVSTISGILDRRRTLALMRLAGMPHTALRRMILAETLLPLLAVFFLSIVLGFICAQLLLSGLTGGRRFVVFELMDPAFFAVLVISLLLAIAAIIATFPTAQRSTALNATRFE
jgi:hypothetical protein